MEDTLQTIREAMARDGQRIDVALYDEASQLVEAGRFSEARDRLSALLALYPDDAQAWMLQSKVHVGLQRWDDALASLDRAERLGQTVSPELRQQLEQRIADRQERAAPGAPDTSPDTAALNAKLRHARSQNQILIAKNRGLEREVNRWAAGAVVVAVVTIVLALVQIKMITGTDREPDPSEPVTAAAPPSAPATAGAPASPQAQEVEPSSASPSPASQRTPSPEAAPSKPGAVRDPGLASLAARALSDAGADNGGLLRASARGSTATLTGKVTDHLQRRSAVDALLALPEITKVDDDAVVNLAARDGTTYTVAAGDSLSRIAYRHYGDQSLSEHILQANPQLGGRINLQIGDKLKIPPAP